MQIDKQALGDIASLIARRFKEDQCLRIAASLSYTSLLSLVPLLAISFSIFSAFPAFEGIQSQIQDYVFENFVPAAGETVSQYLRTFTNKTGSMTTIGIVGLGVTAIMLLATIEDALNRIFRAREKRHIVSRLLMFWALLTLGPLLMGASLSLSTYFYALSEWVDSTRFAVANMSGFLGVVLPNMMVMIALTFFYIFVPNRRVSWRYGIIGAVTAGILFALLKKLFGLYVTNFPSYQALYGVLAAIPLFLVWMYLTWAVILVGALLTASLEDWSHRSLRENKDLSNGELMSGVLNVLHLLKKQHESGGAISDAALHEMLGTQVCMQALGLLKDAGFVAPTDEDKWVLARDLKTAQLSEIYEILGLNVGDGEFNFPACAEAVCKAEKAKLEAVQKSLSEIV